MATLKFNRAHKNGWFSYKQTGVPGAVFVDGRMLTDEQKGAMPESLEVELGFKPAGADLSEAAKEKEAKKAEREAAKAEKAKLAGEKAAARAAKLQEQAAKAQQKAAAAQAKASGGSTEAAPATE